MKKILLSVILCGIGLLSVPAQGPPSRQGPNPGVEKIAKENEKEMAKFHKRKYHLKKVAPQSGSAVAHKARHKDKQAQPNTVSPNSVNPGQGH